MKPLLLFIFSLLFLGVNAQIGIGPESQTLAMDISSDDEEVHISVVNNSTENQSLLWSIELGDNFPSDWLTWVCDINTCYTELIRSCPTSRPNAIAPNETQEWVFHASAQGIQGTGTATLNIIDAVTGEIVGASTIEMNTSPVGVDDVNSLADIKVYPNPTIDYFQVSEDTEVSKIGVYTLIGKKVATYTHNSGDRYNVSDFRNGIYLVRLMDEDGEVLKVVRLSKR